MVKLVLHLNNKIMKNLKMLEQKATILSTKEMNTIKGGMKWTRDRSRNVEDRRSIGGIIAYRRSRTALECLYGG